MQTVSLIRNSSVVLDGNGNGTCPAIGPVSPSETWSVTLISVQCTTNVSEAIASVYLDGNLLGASTWGSTGDSDTGITQALMPGQQLYATWAGGDAGATATMAVLGTRQVGLCRSRMTSPGAAASWSSPR